MRKIVYNLRFIVPGAFKQIATKVVYNYKPAMREAEEWVMSGKGYTCVVEWETFTGNKSITLDYNYVKQQRKARNEYKKAVQKNLFRETYNAV
jgi:hypothetical protein